MKKIVCLSVLMCCIISSYSQCPFPILVKAGFGPSNVKGRGGKAGSSFATALGVETYIGLPTKNKLLYFNPSLDYTNTAYEAGVSLTSTVDKVKVNYLVVGMPIVFSANQQQFKKGENTLLFGIGPYIALATSGKYNTYSSDSYTRMQFGNKVADNRTGRDAGLLFKTGVTSGPVCFNMQYNLGIKNVIPKDRITGNEFIKTRNFFFQLAYKLF